MKNTFAIIGGDKRQSYLAEMLLRDAFPVRAFGNSFTENTETMELALEGSDILLLPFPLSPDGIYLNSSPKHEITLDELFAKAAQYGVKRVFGGAITPAIDEKLVSLGFSVTDYGKNEALLLGNALCTAEGAIEIAMREMPVTVHGLKTVVLGYGRIGRMLALRMKALGANVSAVARKPADRALMETDSVTPFSFSQLENALKNAELIYNTVPSQVIDEYNLSRISPEVLIIDLASAPGGVDGNAAKRLGIRVIWALSLPGKTCPKTAADIIKRAVLSEL